MRSSLAILAAVLASTALSKPLQHQKLHQKRDVVYETAVQVVYEYVYVTETDGASAPSTTAEAVVTTTSITPAAVTVIQVEGHHSMKTSMSTTPAAVSTTTVAATASSSSAVSSTSSGKPSFEDIVLLHHNIHRANHSAPNLVWNSTLASIAQEEASVCSYAHNTAGGGGGYGQNIAAGVKPSDISTVITTMMYNGEMKYYTPAMYGETNPSFDDFEHWGHFSQIVWKATTSVGCAVQYCAGGLANVGGDVPPYFTVCNYYPPGNMGGEYGTNIGKPLEEASVYASYGL